MAKHSFSIPGFKASGIFAGIKKNKKAKDLALIFSETPAAAAGVFTTNIFKAAPVLYSQKIVRAGRAQAIMANSGSANSGTGLKGEQDLAAVVSAAAKILGIKEAYILNASTGKIGVRLPVAKIKAGLKKAFQSLSSYGWQEAGQAIMTTDTRPKIISRVVRLSSGKLKIGAMAKGAGMINPNLATMLVFIATDLKTTPAVLNAALREAVNNSFNQLSVDGCMSTNDLVLMLANGKNQNISLAKNSRDFLMFQKALTELCQNLCRQMASDAEGATKLIEVAVKNAPSLKIARILAKAVVSSDLVKTAVFGADPNWGRVIAALGGASQNFNPAKVTINFGIYPVFKNGQPIEFNKKALKKYLSGRRVKILINLNQGKESSLAFGCDLSYDYVRINAEYN